MKLHIGVDAMAISQMARMIAISPDTYVRRTFTEHERVSSRVQPKKLAARWAAKEAVMKCLGLGLDRLDPLDIEVISTAAGAPDLHLKPRAAARADELQIVNWSLSMTHESDLAIAFAIGYGATN